MVPHHLAIEAMQSKEEEEEGSQRSLSGSPGPAEAATAIEGEEAHAVCRPQLVLEGVVALDGLLFEPTILSTIS